MLQAFRLPPSLVRPMRAWSLAVVPLLLAGAAMAQEAEPKPAAEPTPDVPPQSELVVTIGGKEYPCHAGGGFTADVDGKAIAVAVREKPTKTFDYGGVRFEFPKAHAFESQLDADTRMWTLDGNDNVLILLKPTTNIDDFYAEYVAELKKNYAEQTVVEKPCRQRFGGIEATGTKLTVTLDITSEGTTLCQEVYLVKDSDHGVIVMIQDSLDDKDRQTAETGEVKRLFADTFAFHDESAEAAATTPAAPAPTSPSPSLSP